MYDPENPKTRLWFTNYENHPITGTTLLTQWETPSSADDKYANILSGYFKAPVTSCYKFYMAVDDNGELYFD